MLTAQQSLKLNQVKTELNPDFKENADGNNFLVYFLSPDQLDDGKRGDLSLETRRAKCARKGSD